METENFIAFSDTKPNLIGNDTLKNMQSILMNKSSAVNEYVPNDGMDTFYARHIEPNLFFFVILVIFLLFLYYKYRTKNSNKNSEKKDKKHRDSKNNTSDLEKFIAKLNPNTPISAQGNYTNYVGDDAGIPLRSSSLVPDKSGGSCFVDNYTHDNFYKEGSYAQFHEPPQIQNQFERANTYAGLYNNYNFSADQAYPNPFSWPADFNATQQNAIEYATTRNRDSLAQMNEIVDRDNKFLYQSLVGNINNSGNTEKDYELWKSISLGK